MGRPVLVLTQIMVSTPFEPPVAARETLTTISRYFDSTFPGLRESKHRLERVTNAHISLGWRTPG